MKKLRLVFCSLMAVISFSSCLPGNDTSINPAPDEMARLQSVAIIECLEHEDVEGLKALFCKRVVDGHDLDAEIQEALDFIGGKIVSYDEPDGSVGGKDVRYGEQLEIELRGKILNIKTDEGGVYRLDFSSYTVYKEDPERVGVTEIGITAEDGRLFIIGGFYTTDNPKPDKNPAY